jgi:SAM-dependent methyltransferase
VGFDTYSIKIMKTRTQYTDSNRDAWNASALAHERSEEWTKLLKAVASSNFSVLDNVLTEALKSVNPRGKRTVQIGCNNGRDLLSVRSIGAIPALGIDQSEAFIDQARRLASAAGSDCDFQCANIYSIPSELQSSYDLGLITIGVLNWMPDLSGFFKAVKGLLSDDAPLVIYETHPVLEMFDPEASDPFLLTRSYFDPTPYIEDDVITYDGTNDGKAPTSYWFTHTLGDVVSECISAGFSIASLTEYPHSNREVEYDIYERQDAQLPMCFTLIAYS